MLAAHKWGGDPQPLGQQSTFHPPHESTRTSFQQGANRRLDETHTVHTGSQPHHAAKDDTAPDLSELEWHGQPVVEMLQMFVSCWKSQNLQTIMMEAQIFK